MFPKISKIAIGLSSFVFPLASNSIAQINIIENVHGNSQVSAEEYKQIRCGEIGKTVYFYLQGSMYGQVEGKEPLHLFHFEGVDISRCIEHEGTPYLVSRKISLYKDPVSRKTLRYWENPFTGEKLNVLHRTYDYQEFQIPEKMIAFKGKRMGFISTDFTTFFPNRLASIPEYEGYADYPFVQSVDSYKFIFDLKKLSTANKTDTIETGMSYLRSGVFEPWMKMGNIKGKLVLNYSGTELGGYDEIPEELKTLIDSKMPQYKEAPICRLNRSIGTSWSRFQNQFSAYLAGEEFPLAAPIIEEPCLN